MTGLRILSKIASFLATALLIFVTSRALILALPGDPVDALIFESGASISADALRANLHLDRPWYEAVTADLGNMLHGDFGKSLLNQQPIASVLRVRLARTLALSVSALLLALTVAVALGLLAAAAPGRAADRICTVFGALSAATPTAWLGPLLILAFAVKLSLFETTDSLTLPAITLAVPMSGLWARLIRARVRETLALGAAPGARARGVPEWKILFKYGLVPCSGALLAYLGTQFGGLMAGAFVTEVIFGWKGMGSLLVEAVLKRDLPVVETAVFFSAIFILGGNALGNWLQEIVDPRLSRA